MSEMKYCPSCGTALSASAAFCHNCGQKQKTEIQTDNQIKSDNIDSNNTQLPSDIETEELKNDIKIEEKTEIENEASEKVNPAPEVVPAPVLNHPELTEGYYTPSPSAPIQAESAQASTPIPTPV